MFGWFGDGGENVWDDGVSCGNYWGDYALTGVYTIPGSAGNVDRFPNGNIPDPLGPSTSTPTNGYTFQMLGTIITVGSLIIIIIFVFLILKSRRGG